MRTEEMSRPVPSDRDGCSPEGYVSWFMHRPSSLFAALQKPKLRLRDDVALSDLPGELKDGALRALLPNVITVPIDTVRSQRLWDRYVALRFEGKPPKDLPIVSGLAKGGGKNRRRNPSQRPRGNPGTTGATRPRATATHSG